MSENLESQLRAWTEAVDDPIPVEQIAVESGRHAAGQQRARWVVAAAAVVVLLAGAVAVLAASDDPSDVTAVADDTTREAPTTSAATSAPPTTGEPESSPAPTSTTSATTMSTTTAPTTSPPPRAGTVSEVVDPPSGDGCDGLRSETVWATSGSPDEITAPAGGSAGYVETVTNEGATTCSMEFVRCPGLGELFTAEGDPAPRRSVGCPSIGYPPEELPPGASRRAAYAVALFTAPGSYELRARQHDGRIATLPIRLDDRIPACAPRTLALDQQPHESYVRRGETVFAQLRFDASQSCTIRITASRLSLRASDQNSAREHLFVDESQRWHATGEQAVVADAFFEPPIDLPPAQYEGTITVHLESGETFTKPARVLVG